MKKILALVIALSTIGLFGVAYAENTVKKLPDEINLITHHNQNDATTLNLSWINPSYAISAITVTEPTLGTISENATIDLRTGASNKIVLSGLTSGTIYTFTVKITPADTSDATEVFTITGKAASIDLERCTEEGYDITWYFKYENRSDWGGRYIDSSTKVSGDSSLKIANNSAYIGMKGEDENCYQLQAGYTYEFSFWTKSNLRSGIIKWMDDWTDVFSVSDYSSEWKKNTYTITDVIVRGSSASYKVTEAGGSTKIVSSSDNNIMPRIIVDGIGTVWIDDIEFYIIDSNGARSENKFRNGKFEHEQGFLGTSGISATGDDGSATISWTNPGGTITEAVVLDENLEVVATGNTTTQGANSIILDGLTNNTIHKFYIRIITNGVTQYIPIEVIPNEAVSPLTLTKDGEAVERLTEGTIRVSRSIANYIINNGTFDAELIAALYKDDTLIGLWTDAASLVWGESDELWFDVIIPDMTEGSFELQVFLWDSLEGQEYIRAMQSFN